MTAFLQLTAWQGVLTYAATVVFGIVTNLAIAAYYAGKYKERVDRLTAEVDRYEEKVENNSARLGKLERQFAALTGKANGESFSEEGD